MGEGGGRGEKERQKLSFKQTKDGFSLCSHFHGQIWDSEFCVSLPLVHSLEVSVFFIFTATMTRDCLSNGFADLRSEPE